MVRNKPSNGRTPNRLAGETSPYLRQHQHNPVDWYPWGPDALQRARDLDRPILLSIGYSACHWCHVMAHESFEDEDTARVMNELYVNIKVDREERPDLDKLYQLAHQALAQRGGGWPLTAVLAPDDLVPYFAGTYFPNQPRYGMPAFVEVLRKVRDWYDHNRDQVREQNGALQRLLGQLGTSQAGLDATLGPNPIDAALAALERGFDHRHGGFGAAPKFPHASELELLLRASIAGPAMGKTRLAHAPFARASETALAQRSEAGPGSFAAMVERSLGAMAQGGIHDQLGGGFCRYSVDARWEIPHFEKMLYDNALLLPLYARAARLFQRADFQAAAHGIVAFVERELRNPDGGYCAALDADSEGEEGRYYLWRAGDARALLTVAEWAVLAPHYGFDLEPNFEHSAWNPRIAEPLAEVAPKLGLGLEQAQRLVESARAKLFRARAERVRPGLDDKVLTSWNALLASGLYRAARYLDAPELARLAHATVEFLHDRAWTGGRLHATVQRGQARFPAYLDDHASLLEALIEGLRTRFDPARLAWACQLAERLLDEFEDREHGGFWFTPHEHEYLPARQKPWTDDAVPSGNGVAARALLRLGHLLGEPRYLHAAERALKAAHQVLTDMPQAAATLLSALYEHLDPGIQVVIRPGDAQHATAWLVLARELCGSRPVASTRGGRYGANGFAVRDLEVYLVPDSHAGAALPGVLGARKPMPGGVAYVCRGTSCLAPIRSPEALRAALA